jgi:hypothetical protein
MPDYRGIRYEVKKVAGGFQGLMWPPGAHRMAPGLIVVPRAASVESAERLVKERIDNDLKGKRGT